MTMDEVTRLRMPKWMYLRRIRQCAPYPTHLPIMTTKVDIIQTRTQTTIADRGQDARICCPNAMANH